jgi:cyclophilin family peptidyl-prolyl cis-trans isomerase
MHSDHPEPGSQLPPGTASSKSRSRSDRRQRALLLVGFLSVLVAGGIWLYRLAQPPRDDLQATVGPPSEEIPIPATPRTSPREEKDSQPSLAHLSQPGPKKNQAFLDSFLDKDVSRDDDNKPAQSSAQLEHRFRELTGIEDAIALLQERLGPAPVPKSMPGVDDLLRQIDKLSEKLGARAAEMEGDLARARRQRPGDPIPQWLTGELLIFVGGEPDKILPFLRRAVDAGLQRPRLWASLSRVQLKANEFSPAYAAARKALDQDDQQRFFWFAYTRAAFALERFTEVRERIDRAFPSQRPEWASAIRRDAIALETGWHAELIQRQAEEKANDLPRVRLIIEHRRFQTDNGKPTTRVENTGTGTVLLELFEDSAPNSVANFLTLVEKKFYDGTRFFLAEPASLVAGGCPKTRNDDPADDGTGGPGYFLPDEFRLPKARQHFRGSLSMVNSGAPNSSGSQFLITLVPHPEMNGRFTVFGRVLEGQEVLDRMTPGRTHPHVGAFGRIIPGDVLVRAEVVRKRPHPYGLTKIMK